MTRNEFATLCARYTIEPAIALENNNVVECLLDMRDTSDDNAYRGYRNALIMILESEF